MDPKRSLAALKQLLTPEGGLGRQTTISAIWVFSLKYLSRGLNILMLIILARLLGPRDLGIYGMAVVAVTGLNRVTEIGVSEALIQQKRSDVDEFLNTSWVLYMLRGLIVFTTLYLLAPYIARLFGEPTVSGILRLMAVAPLLLGFRNPGIIYFQKSLQFHKQFVYQLSGAVVRFCVGVGLGLYWGSIWALPVAYVSMDVTRLLMSYLVQDYRPWFGLDPSVVRDLLGYGKWVTGSSILNFLYSRGDDVVVGVVLTSTALGWYQMAYRLAMAPVSEVSGTVSTVLFPTFSKLQDDPDQLKTAFFRSLRITLFVSVPMSFGVISVAPVFVKAFLGQAWVPMTTTLQLVALYGLLVTVGPTFGAVWKAVGRPDYVTKLMFVRVVMMAILILPATWRFGIEGAALTIIAITVIPNMPLNFYLIVEHTLDTTYRRFAKELAYPILASTVMLGAVLGVQTAVSQFGAAIEFGLLVVTGVIVYFVVSVILTSNVGWEVDRDIKWLISTAARST